MLWLWLRLRLWLSVLLLLFLLFFLQRLFFLFLGEVVQDVLKEAGAARAVESPSLGGSANSSSTISHIVVATIIVVVMMLAMPVPTGEAHCTAAREANMPPRPRNGGIESDEALYAPQPLVLHELVDLSQNGYA